MNDEKLEQVLAIMLQATDYENAEAIADNAVTGEWNQRRIDYHRLMQRWHEAKCKSRR
ncbi:hypothetical protein GOA99_20335 [Sinorhizobium meliloti]|nr:hypothetical protein [Sinorhizobium meliloti]MDX0930517.1 hypothetical protein [Sinorhizobium medicae]